MHHLASSIGVAALNALAIAIVICDRSGRALFVNTAADTLQKKLKSELLPFVQGNAVGAGVQGETRRLIALIGHVIDSGRVRLFRLQRPADSGPLVAMVSSLPQSATEEPLAMLAFRPLSLEWTLTEQALSEAFDLTPTQAEVALEIFNGKSVGTIARQRSSKISTVRTHLAEIFARTKTQNQRELIRLLGSIPPVASPLTPGS